jgi:LmbE family N-acetylglucosaminyl deacetylase
MTARRVLVCAAHPDDEVLGCGGAIARHSKAGDDVFIVFVSDGVLSRPKDADIAAAELHQRQAAARRAAHALGAREPVFLGFPDQRLDTLALLDVTQTLEGVLTDVQPNTIYTHHAGDLNSDHRIVTAAVLTATRPVPGQQVTAIFGYEVLSSTEWAFGSTVESFHPNHFVSIEATLADKMRALRCYEYEMREFPHARSYDAVEALAKVRGAAVGEIAAEAFTTMRTIIR